jgi:hypothetical protein
MKRLWVSLACALALFTAPALAQGKAKPPAPGDLKLDVGKLKGTKGGKLTQAKLASQAADITRGYYDALISGNFDAAVGFMHPDAIEPTREQIVKKLEASNDGQRTATLKTLGVTDLNTLRTMPADRFFLLWARSPLGQSVQALSSDKIKVRVVVDPPRCNLPTKTCQVRVTLRGDTHDGKKIEKPNSVFIVEKDGRYLLRDTPPPSLGKKVKGKAAILPEGGVPTKSKPQTPKKKTEH